MTEREIIRTVWTYRINGTQMGTYTEQYARDMYEATRRTGAVNTELVAMDHVASDFETTGRNWIVETRVVESSLKSVGELAYEAGATASRIDDPYSDVVVGTPYYHDAAYLALNLFSLAEERGKLSKVVYAYSHLAEHEGHRVLKLMISLKRGRFEDVLRSLLDYQFKIEA